MNAESFILLIVILIDHFYRDKNYKARIDQIRFKTDIDGQYGYTLYTSIESKSAWLVNIQPSEMIDEQTKDICSCVDYYFLEENGERFKIAYPFKPYFLIGTVERWEIAVSNYLEKKYPDSGIAVEHIEKENLDLKNHLSGLKSKFIKVSFPSLIELQKVRREISSVVEKNKERVKSETGYQTILAKHLGLQEGEHNTEPVDQIIDIREFDLPYHMRVSIDEKIFAGLWYNVHGCHPATRKPSIKRDKLRIEPADPVVLAYDIETTKLPLKFPDAAIDQIMMISYMIDGQGYLITNREIISRDIQDFTYTPRPEYPGEFIIFNAVDEKALIIRFFNHIIASRPSIIVTYNGDFFDFPFVDKRATAHNLSMLEIIGFAPDSQGEYKSDNCLHMDAFRWVKRDSYLPMGSQGLKACTKAKLGYDPSELDPELMMYNAKHNPQKLATYSVSDAVATYYLYMKYVHPFIFALCTIIPLGGDDVLRKGSGTLCEALLMVEAFHNNIIFPNKQISYGRKITADNRVLESETYVGGHVEALESGVFRSDIKTDFSLNVECLEMLRNKMKNTMEFALTVENSIDMNNVVDFEEQCELASAKLRALEKNPVMLEFPKIYHLDVGAMYPNIILTNRLQPPAMVTEEDCVACVHNTVDAKCKRDMQWMWRGEMLPCNKGEYDHQIMSQLERQSFGKPPVPFHDLPKEEKDRIEKERVNAYNRRVYSKLHITKTEIRTTRICQRENGFFVDTVKAFRDRRYDYKELLKKSKGELSKVSANDVVGIKDCQSRVILYESLQMAHKCILNSFYGYAMRKGSRWFSMEMAGIVCKTGADIIQEARKIVERIGRPLELDTDGIWCMLPSSLPENITFKLKNCKKDSVTISYSGSMLNSLVKDLFTNDQYHVVQPNGDFEIVSENSIFFEVDGPYLAMILPASKEEGKKLKKRYAVFNFDGSLSELKGFEMKRRGELEIIKNFQKNVFKMFLKGDTLATCYKQVAKEADYWLDVLESKGVDLEDGHLIELISENRSMSKKLEDYGSQKSTSITTAKRLAEILGDDMVRDAGLACKFIISEKPLDAPVTERAIPLALFQSDPRKLVQYLRKWTKDEAISMNNKNLRDILDWKYYRERLGNTIQKIITIPAALQGVANPVPRLPHPDWLDNLRKKKIFDKNQPKIDSIFKVLPKKVQDIENLRTPSSSQMSSQAQSTTTSRKRPRTIIIGEEDVNTNGGTTAKKIRAASTDYSVKKTITEDGFEEWLKHRKFKWNELRQQIGTRKNQITMASDRQLTSLEKMVISSKSKMIETNWQIIDISPTEIGGIFKVFAIVCGMMKKFTLNVRRHFYVNQYKAKVGQSAITQKKILPRSKPLLNLYEYSVNESDFEKRISAFRLKLCEKELEGIYETQMPLDFRCLLNVGALAKVVSLRIATDDKYSMEELEMVPLSGSNPDATYLQGVQLKKLYFYEYDHSSQQIAAFISPSHGAGTIFIVNKSTVEIQNPNDIYKKVLHEFINKFSEDYFQKDLYSKVVLKVQQVRQLSSVSTELLKMHRQLRFADTDPYILLVQSNNTRSYLTETYSILSYFPHIRINYQEPRNLLSSMEWRNILVERICKHFFYAHISLQELSLQASYLNIPIGNIKEDFPSFAADVLYARGLSKLDYILWATNGPEPDLGGKNTEDFRITTDWDTVSFRTHNSYIENKEVFKIGKVVVDIDIKCIAVAALIQQTRIAEAEGTSDSLGFTSGTELAKDKILGKETYFSHMDEAAASNKAVTVLRQVIVECYRDILAHNNDLANEIITNIHKWVRCSRSMLYDPAIAKAVTILMKKLSCLLVAEITKQGCEVIHCSYTRLIFSTEKNDMKSAQQFVESMIKVLQSKPLFAGIVFDIQKYWDLFAWIDPSNYASMKINEHSDQDEFIYNWSMSSYFSQEVTRTEFCKFFGGYFSLLASKMRGSVNSELFPGQRKQIIEKIVAPKVFELIGKNLKIYCDSKMPNELPPIYKAECIEYNVPLQMTNCFIKMLSLDDAIAEEVEILKSQSMKMLSVDIYSSKSNWKPINYSCVIDHLLCHHCDESTELDVCLTHTRNNGEHDFICSGCKKPLDQMLIEQHLLQRAHKMVLALNMQDFKCSTCKTIRNLNLTTKCICSNKFDYTITKKELISCLKILKSVAQTNGFDYLEEFVSSIC
uniref:DNA polymerase epsilon catalytic subunit n=1 Tax=Rhabditophanes sp. KR3021 TaxID=114890 RepID=A0AC35TLD7_9BILA